MKNRNVSIWFIKRLSFALYLFFFSLLIFSCSSNKKSTTASNYIDVEKAVGSGEILNLSDYASDIEYIPLETNKMSVLGTIRDIAYRSNKIYVRDNNNVVKIFDNSGKYLSTIDRNGRGPEEYNSIGWSSPSPCGRGVYVLDSSGDLFLYDHNGLFVEKREFPKEEYMRFSSFTFLDSGFIAAAHALDMSAISAGKIKHTLFLLDNSLNVIDKKSFFQEGGIKTTMDGDKIISISISIKNIYLHNYENQVRFLFNSQDTIHTVNREAVFKDAFVLNLGKYKDNEAAPDHMPDNLSEFIKLSPPFFETDNHLYLQFDFGENAPEKVVTERLGINGEIIPTTDAIVNAIFNKQSGKLILLDRPSLNKKGFLEDIKGGHPFWPRFMGANGELMAYINAYEFDDAAEDDNPVVVIVKPKKQ